MAGKYTVSNLQEQASAIPGNIGIIKAKVNIWDNDPLLSRPFQQTTYPFSQDMVQQYKEQLKNLKVEIASIFLEPQYYKHDMWVAALSPDKKGGKKLDFVNFDKTYFSEKGPGGSIYNLNGLGKNVTSGSNNSPSTDQGDDATGRDMFMHQVWVHVGNLFSQEVLIYPSEYNDSLSSIIQARGIDTTNNAFLNDYISKLQSAPKWNTVEAISSDGRSVVWPDMTSKQSPKSAHTTHWTLEKLTPIWQCQDFHIDIAIGSRKTDPTTDIDTNDVVDSDTELYKYLCYNPKKKPFLAFATEENEVPWVDGISNEAFYIPPENGKDNITEARKKYWWKFKSYILIEIGHQNTGDNYFIELCEGRNPRFLRLGWEWDDITRTGQVLKVNKLQDSQSKNNFRFVFKCKEIGSFGVFKSEELFDQGSTRISVRNHLGKIVITFKGYEDQPWIINRLDNDPTKFDFSKVEVPCIVPAGKLRIHGGGITCSVGYAPTRYASTAKIHFDDRQADTIEAKDKDLYMTFANIGGIKQYTKSRIKKQYFKDKAFIYRKIGWESDIYTSGEIIGNKYKEIPVYEIYPEQFKKIGRGWIQTNNGLVSGFKPGIAEPHKAKFYNHESPGKAFKFGVEEEDVNPKDLISRWDVGIQLSAGSVIMPKFDNLDILGDDFNAPNATAFQDKIFRNYITPIVNNWSLIVLGGAKPFGKNYADENSKAKIEPFDITNLVTHINDSWSTDGINTITHDMKIRCYIPDEMLPISTNPGDSSFNLHALGQKLLSLHKQAFYITVSYWWENGVGERDAPGNITKRNEPPKDSDLLIQMTGIAYGADLEKTTNRLFMNFDVKDYSSILENQPIFNSPLFSSVSDAEAIYELARLAFIDDDSLPRKGIDRRPLGYLQKVITDPNVVQSLSFKYNGEESIYRSYDLPGTYADFAGVSGVARFQNGETYLSAMTKIATLATKILYFDRWGVLKFENSPAIEAAFQAIEVQSFKPRYQFVTTPFHLSNGASETQLAGELFLFDPNKHAAHQVFETVGYSRKVEDCFNQIVVYTASKDITLADGSHVGGFIAAGHTFYDQILDPTVEGFIGYRKMFYQSNGVFGGIDSVRKTMQHYAKFKFPPAVISFQTYSVPGLKALDIISLDDNLFYITEISHDIDPSTNKAWMQIQGQWLKPYIGFIQERGISNANIIDANIINLLPST